MENLRSPRGSISRTPDLSGRSTLELPCVVGTSEDPDGGDAHVRWRMSFGSWPHRETSGGRPTRRKIDIGWRRYRNRVDAAALTGSLDIPFPPPRADVRVKRNPSPVTARG